MTISPSAPTTVDVATHGQLWKAITTRFAAAYRTAQARSQARRDYEELLMWDDDDILRDIGVTRRDVRQALRALDGRG